MWVRVPLSGFGYGGNGNALDFGSSEQLTFFNECLFSCTGSIPVKATTN